MYKNALIIALLMVSAPSGAKETVKEFHGSGNTTTSIFTVEAPWVLDWRLDGDYTQLVALDITLVEGHGGRHVGRVLHTKHIGNGVRLFSRGGQYKLRISSTLANWTLKVQQLTPEEADRYTPKEKS